MNGTRENGTHYYPYKSRQPSQDNRYRGTDDGARTRDGRKMLPEKHLFICGNIITRLERTQDQKVKLIDKLQQTLGEVKTLRGIIPICASCKNIRDDQGFWNKVEAYFGKHSEVNFTHGICPDCAQKLYPDLMAPEDKKEPTFYS